MLGWGERPALQPDPRHGYKLIPSQETRLRGLSYDYVVEANELGFPGPLYPAERTPGTLRILVTGDAYESAEGVDTNQSWPRLLEQRLRDRGVPVEVLNFSITGWGPNQYQAVIQNFVPVYRPDLVIVGFFVNEFDDVLVSDERYQNAPGFDAPPKESLRYFLSLTHLRAWIKNSLRSGPLAALRPDKQSPGYFFGCYLALERDQLAAMESAASLVEQRLREIKQTTEQHDSRLLIVQIPAPAQICPPESVEYTPPGIDLSDDARFDLDQPQRITRRICTALQVDCVDLRPAFEGSASLRPCQPKNLYWTQAGHNLVADFVTKRLLENPALWGRAVACLEVRNRTHRQQRSAPGHELAHVLHGTVSVRHVPPLQLTVTTALTVPPVPRRASLARGVTQSEARHRAPPAIANAIAGPM